MPSSYAETHNSGMMDWNDLRPFLAVYRHGSTLAASRTLKVSQSTVLRRIQALEAKLGLSLFDKTPGGYAPTAAARSLIARAEAAEREIEAFMAAAHAERRQISARIRLTANDAFNIVLQPALSAFRTEHPEMRIDLTTTSEILDLEAGKADVALRGLSSPPNQPDLIGRRICIDSWSVYCTRSYAASHGVPASLATLPRHSFFTVDENFPRVPLVLWLERHVPAEAIALRQNSIGGLLTSVRAGFGFTLMSDFLAAADPALQRCFTPEIDQWPEIWLLYPERLRGAPRVRLFIEYLASYFAAGRHVGKAPPA